MQSNDLFPDKVVMFLHVVYVPHRHDLIMMLEDVTTKSGLTDKWEDVKSSVAQFTKRKQWLGSEEKTVSKPNLRQRFATEGYQPWNREVAAEKGVDESEIE